MILHTIIDINEIFYQQDKPLECTMSTAISKGNTHFEGEQTEQGMKIQRVISTNPNDYLDVKYKLGEYIK